MDEPSEEIGLLEFIGNFKEIQWRVLINRTPHEWRNPAKAVNVGIRASSKDYIMVCSPESMFSTDAIFRLRYIAENYGKSFAIGKVVFSIHDSVGRESMDMALPYGSIMVKRKYIEQISGYTEGFAQWGGEDDNFRAKLEYIGLKKILVSDAVLIHYEDQVQGYAKRSGQSKSLPIEIKRKAYLTDPEDFQDLNWGKDFSEVIFDYAEVSDNGT